MKEIKISIGLSLAVLISLPVLLVNCKKDDAAPLNDQQMTTKKLTATWGSTVVESSPVTGADGTLKDVIFTFTATGNFQPAMFTATGAPDYFRSSAGSTWSWGDTGPTTKILLTNVLPVQEFSIEELTEKNLTISFEFSGPVGGRTQGIGEYRLRMTRQ